MQQPKDAPAPEPQTNRVTYVIVVHGIGEQRKNETVISVVNRFAEARRTADADDNRDVLTLGQASGQTGLSKVPTTEQPWMEFDGIPAEPPGQNATPLKPFLGAEPKDGENLRFVDLCWSDVMQDSVEHVGQDADVWAKGLLGRLLRKHEAAGKESNLQVPFWILRVLYLLVDTLLLVRFGMSFRFKEMKELVFVKFLGDVQLYGEYSRCRGHAVRRFHELMRRIEDAHYACEPAGDQQRDPRYVIIAHSLGSIMSFDALLYASATCDVRRGKCDDWKFPGYLRNDDELSESKELRKLDEQQTTTCLLSKKKRRELRRLEDKFAFLNTEDWIERVESFVTLGSPIDKFLTIWWLNYRYLLCADRVKRAEPRITHFNYCDELDPVGHNLDVARETPGYKSVFEWKEDVVFNRYAVPGAAHNKYWTDQRLFRRILDWTVDKAGSTATRVDWFDAGVYRKLLFALYRLVPLLLLAGTYASLSLAFQAHGWRSAAVAAAVFSFLGHLGCRLIDLSIWWRQIQRQKSKTFWDTRCSKEPDRTTRKTEERRFRCWVRATPAVWAAAALGSLACLAWQTKPWADWSKLMDAVVGSSLLRLVLVLGVAATVVHFLRRRRLPTAYRVRAYDESSKDPNRVPGLMVGFVAAGVGAVLIASASAHPGSTVSGVVTHTALISVLATGVYAYRLYRFRVVKRLLDRSEPSIVSYSDYASHLRTTG